jgi:hypothetical protein
LTYCPDLPPTVRGRAELRASWRLWDEGHRVDQRVDVLMLALFARMERSYARERAAHVRAVAVAHGRRVGRPKLAGDDQLDYARRLRDDGVLDRRHRRQERRRPHQPVPVYVPPRPAAAVTAGALLHPRSQGPPTIAVLVEVFGEHRAGSTDLLQCGADAIKSPRFM